jgi:hypothetical protein
VLIVKGFLKLAPIKVYVTGTNHTSIVNLIKLTMFSATMSVCSDNELKPTNTLSGRNFQFLDVQACGI